jgi:hypothetical protein
MNTENKIEDGGPAFPSGKSETPGYENSHPYYEGMSLRDWFAGQQQIDNAEDFEWALLETLAGPRPKGDWRTNPMEWFNWSNKWQAKVKYARADAMIEAGRVK